MYHTSLLEFIPIFFVCSLSWFCEHTSQDNDTIWEKTSRLGIGQLLFASLYIHFQLYTGA